MARVRVMTRTITRARAVTRAIIVLLAIVYKFIQNVLIVVGSRVADSPRKWSARLPVNLP